MSCLAEFAQKWCHPEYPPTPVDAAELAQVEAELGLLFPQDYKDQVLEVGLPHPTLALLSAILGRGKVVEDLSSLHAPQMILDETRGWVQAGMPDWIVVIGSDCAGNSFGFDMRKLRAKQVAKAPVLFWDHDFGTTSRVARSFPAWIKRYSGRWAKGLTYADF